MVASSEGRGLYLVNITDFVDEVRKRDEMRGLSSMLSIFRYKLNTYNSTGEPMLDSIHQETSK